jgi:pyrroline-5-carboxylate reductase
MMRTVGFIGGGVMAEAICAGLLRQQTYAPTQILISDPVAARRAELAARYQISVTDSNQSVVDIATEIVLAIKPQIFAAVTREIAPGLKQRTNPPWLLSILAGMPLSRLEAALPGLAVVRAMPNTPATAGAAVTALSMGSQTSAEQQQQARELMQSIGLVIDVPESLMDAVTGLSGSGPAYVALMLEALADGGVAAGLPRATAQQLALQTVLGTAQLLQTTGLHPALLKDQVLGSALWKWQVFAPR